MDIYEHAAVRKLQSQKQGSTFICENTPTAEQSFLIVEKLSVDVKYGMLRNIYTQVTNHLLFHL